MNRGGNVRAKRAAMVAFVVAALGGATAAISDLIGVDTFPSLSGIGLAVALFATGFGLVAWAKHVGFDDHAVEEREPLAMTDVERDALRAQLDESEEELGRRGVLTGLFALALGMLGVALIGPIGSLDSQASGDRQAHPMATRRPPRHVRRRTRAGRHRALRSADHGLSCRRADRRRLAGGAGTSAARPPQRSGPSPAALSTAGSPTRRSVPTPAVRSDCSASTAGRRSSCASSCARATSRCSIRSTRPGPSAARRRDRCRNSRSAIDDEGMLVALSDFDQPVGPIAWNEA